MLKPRLAAAGFYDAGHPHGRLLHCRSFASRHVTARAITLRLPEICLADPTRRFPVLYAHDGQNLFDPETAFIGIDWGFDQALARIAAGGVEQAIVVGPWNSPLRYREYDAESVWRERLNPSESRDYAAEFGEPCGDAYLRFIVEELKPFIDAHLPTRPEAAATFLIGSSMGGVISAYGLCRHPEVFGAAACLSTHWPTCRGRLVDWLGENLPEPGQHRFYFDYGTATLDAAYEPYQQRADALLRCRGYREGIDWITRKFPGDDHSERAWRSRLDIPLTFLLNGMDPLDPGAAP